MVCPPGWRACPDCGLSAAQDKAGKETNGFKSRMGARGAAPRLLRLKPEDLAQVGSAPLQKGKFTWVTESGREERWIVASCGNYTVLWNFRCARLLLRRLKQASCPCHVIPLQPAMQMIQMESVLCVLA